MGRHSAPDDDVVTGADTTTLPRVTDTHPTLDLGPLRRGRHASGDDEELQPPGELRLWPVLDPSPDLRDARPTQMIAAVDVAVLDSADTRAEAQTGVLAAVADPVVVLDFAPEQPVETAAPEQAKKARGESGTRADLRLLREKPIVRAEILGAVVVAFGLYALVMALLGRFGDFATWVWIPIVVTGILIGVVLDLAHRRYRPAEREPAEHSVSEPAGTSADH